MKMRTFLLLAAPLLARPVHAGDLDLAQVPADANWVAHLDFTAFLNSNIGKFVITQADKPEIVSKIQELKDNFHFDPRTDLDDITLYGVDEDEEKAVAILNGKFDVEQLTAILQNEGSYAMRLHGERKIHSIIPKDGKDAGKTKMITFFDAGTIVLGGSLDRVKKGIDVLSGESGALGKSVLVEELSKNVESPFWVAYGNLAELKKRPDSPIMQKAETGGMVFGENDGNLAGIVAVQTSDNDTAQQMESMALGMLAFAALQQPGKGDFPPINQLVKVQRRENVVWAEMGYPVSELVIRLEEMIEKKGL